MTRYMAKLNADQLPGNNPAEWAGWQIKVLKAGAREVDNLARRHWSEISQGDELWLCTEADGPGISAKAEIAEIRGSSTEIVITLGSVAILSEPVALSDFERRKSNSRLINRLQRSRKPDVYILDEDVFREFERVIQTHLSPGRPSQIATGMRETLRRICELQPAYSSENTPEMQERGRLIRHVLPDSIRALQEPLSASLGAYGSDFYVEGSDGIGRKTELAWTRFCSEEMSPRPTDGFYVVLHFSTDGSGVNIAVSCSSSRFHNGYSIVLPPEQLDERCKWARKVVLEDRGSLEPFTDINDFGAKARLPKSFERACALVKMVAYDDIEDAVMERHMTEAAEMLRAIYAAQRQGRELSPADQTELEILDITRPTANVRKGQGFGLTAKERKVVELRAMEISEEWLHSQGYRAKNTAATKPYDFEATKGDDILYVEVKGTTSDVADAIAMTHGEVALHRREKGKTALMIVSGVRLDRDSNQPRASGGTLEALIGWDIDDWLECVQEAAKEGATRFLYEMATGTGKTLTSAALIKLFLKTRNAKRVLFWWIDLNWRCKLIRLSAPT